LEAQQQQQEKKDVQPSFNLDPGRNLLFASPKPYSSFFAREK